MARREASPSSDLPRSTHPPPLLPTFIVMVVAPEANLSPLPRRWGVTDAQGELRAHPLLTGMLGMFDAAAGERNGGAFLPFAKAAVEEAALLELALTPTKEDKAEADGNLYFHAAETNGVPAAQRNVRTGVKPA